MPRVQKGRKDEQCCQTAGACIKLVSSNRWLYSQKGRKDEQCCQTAGVCIKLVSSNRWLYSLFSDL